MPYQSNFIASHLLIFFVVLIAMASNLFIFEKQAMAQQSWPGSLALIKALPPSPNVQAWQIGKPDLILKLPQAYNLAASSGEVFRNFVIPVPVTARRYVKAVEILPSNPRVVRHASIWIDRSRSLRSKAKQAIEVGFDGVDIKTEAESFQPDSQLLFWKPGYLPHFEADETPLQLEPETDLVLSLHLHNTGRTEQVQVLIGIYFSNKPPTKFPMLLELSGQRSLNAASDNQDFAITDDFILPVDLELRGIYPHAHYPAKEVQAYAALPDGTSKPIIGIKNWTLADQVVRMFEPPLFLPKGTMVVMRCVYDKASLNSLSLVANQAGNKAKADLTAHMWFEVLPRTAEDSRAVLQEALLQQRLRKYPSDLTSHFNLGLLLQALNRHPEAISHFQQVIQSQPNNFIALANLGTSLSQTGKIEEAISAYQQALQIQPNYATAQSKLASILIARGQFDEAITHLQQVITTRPNDADAYNSLGSALAMKGNWTEAAKNFIQAVRVNPANAEAHYNLGYVLAFMGQRDQAIIYYEKSLRLNPQNAEGQNELGMLYVRQGKLAQAIACFEKALQINPQHAGAKENLKRAKEQMK